MVPPLAKPLTCPCCWEPRREGDPVIVDGCERGVALDRVGVFVGLCLLDFVLGLFEETSLLRVAPTS